VWAHAYVATATAFRLWLNPIVLAANQLTSSDVVNACCAARSRLVPLRQVGETAPESAQFTSRAASGSFAQRTVIYRSGSCAP